MLLLLLLLLLVLLLLSLLLLLLLLLLQECLCAAFRSCEGVLRLCGLLRPSEAFLRLLAEQQLQQQQQQQQQEQQELLSSCADLAAAATGGLSGCVAAEGPPMLLTPLQKDTQARVLCRLRLVEDTAASVRCGGGPKLAGERRRQGDSCTYTSNAAAINRDTPHASVNACEVKETP